MALSRWVSSCLLLFLMVHCLAATCCALDLDSDDEWDIDAPPSGPQVRSLSDHNFEHDTQAATGQTTGAWLVLFTDAHCDKCRDAKLALIDVAVDGQPILAEVSVLDSPKTGKRFSVSKVPELRLFRDRHMYVYKGELNGPAIKEFVQGGWKNTVAEDVPAETSWLADTLDELRNLANACLQYLAKRPGLLAAVGAVLATGGYVVTRRLLGMKPRNRRKRARPSGRPHKKAG
ncbi:unnamed protein product [Sphagnum jensenii]|uniref:Thioredoxin domain-containing protein n=1 Tax=Sphagnum jensenii TaxID=128206 RepID=A0ABP0X8B1_9BRYO